MATPNKRVNFQKSKFNASPSVPRREILKYSAIYGMSDTKDLGTYLGIPIIHGRVKKNHFNFIINKVQRKLAGWKAKVLSLACRATIVQSVTSMIPNYIMLVHKIPMSICKDVDRINKNFLWGETGEKKKVHLMKWQKVCTPKNMGGLGIRNRGNNNKGMVSKIG